MSDLNPQQRAAVRYVDGPLLVLAGAGSGKTRVIAHKIAHLVNERGYEPRQIAAITFTNKAAREMQERAAALSGGRPLKGLTVCTFHALGVRLLRAEAQALSLKPQFSILDAADAHAVIADSAGTVDLATTRRLAGVISMWKNALVSPEAARSLVRDDLEQQAAQVYARYQATLRAYQAVDFDDLLRLPVALFENDSAALIRWQARLRYLLVDEYQDTNTAQYRLLRLLAGENAAFTAVGDDDQAIYAWRGANAENLRLLREDYPRLHVIKLEQNYRSSGRILAAANTLIANNEKLFEKRLWSELGPGDPITVTTVRDDEAEAETVVMKLMAHRIENRARFGDYAILYRGNHQARPFEEQLRSHKVPYVLSGGTSFFERAEIKDITAYLRLLANPDDDPAFIRAVTTPRRGVGAATLEALGAYAGDRHVSMFEAVFAPGLGATLAARQLEPLTQFCDFINRMQWRAEREPPAQVLPDLLRAIDYEAWLYDQDEPRRADTRWANVQSLVEWLSRKGEEDGKNLIELAQTIALFTMLEGRDERLDAVQLSTLHAAKGLEFKHVFLVGVEEGILPHRECVDGGKVDEERRLMYVGVTRAQRSLHITHCLKRKRARDWVEAEPSRFIAELGEDLRRAGEGAAPTVTQTEGNQRLAALKAMLQAKSAG